jgi:predicted amidophosphoribosyltransferase
MLDLLLPRRCIACGAARTLLCDACRCALPQLVPPLCERCGAPTAWPVAHCRECSGRRLAFVRARAAVPYDADIRRLVRLWKERGLRSLAAHAAAVVAERLTPPAASVVTFVPPEPGRRRRRGYHPAEQLARALASEWGLECEPLLVRERRPRRQQGLGRAERRRNMAGGVFTARASPPAAVLVDDVYTTGSTADAAAAALGGDVEVVTFARAIRDAGLR